MVYDTRDDDVGLGLIVVSGYKAGPDPQRLSQGKLRSRKAQPRTSTGCCANWNDWFCYTYVQDARRADAVPIEGTW